MTTEEITLRVTPEAAEAFRRASPADQLKLATLVSLQLLAKLQPPRPLDEIIEDISKHAQEAGLTPELLDELLRDDG